MHHVYLTREAEVIDGEAAQNAFYKATKALTET